MSGSLVSQVTACSCADLLCHKRFALYVPARRSPHRIHCSHHVIFTQSNFVGGIPGAATLEHKALLAEVAALRQRLADCAVESMAAASEPDQPPGLLLPPDAGAHAAA